MQLTINITQEHINAGRRDDCYKCPTALAVKEATHGRWNKIVEARVGKYFIGIKFFDGKSYFTTIPYDLQDFIAAFDGARAVEPLTVNLRNFQKGFGPI